MTRSDPGRVRPRHSVWLARHDRWKEAGLRDVTATSPRAGGGRPEGS